MTTNEMRQQAERYLDDVATEAEQEELVRSMMEDRDLGSWFRTRVELSKNDIPADVQRRVLRRVMFGSESRARSLSPEKNSSRKGMQRFHWAYAAAACVGLIMIMGIGGGCYLAGKASPSDMPVGALMVKTNVGERSTLTLPDGTTVQMNALSNLTYDYTDGKRQVTLDGEAFFQVAKDAKHPFIVTCDGVDVECLGTAFDVRAYNDEKQMQVVLQEGKVRVSSNVAQMTMEPNTRVVIDRGSLTMSKQPVTAEQYVCWTRGEVRYNDQTLEEIAADLGRTYHVSLVITSDELKHERFTGFLGQCSLRNVLDLLAMTSNLNYYFDKDTVVYVYAKK